MWILLRNDCYVCPSSDLCAFQWLCFVAISRDAHKYDSNISRRRARVSVFSTSVATVRICIRYSLVQSPLWKLFEKENWTFMDNIILRVMHPRTISRYINTGLSFWSENIPFLFPPTANVRVASVRWKAKEKACNTGYEAFPSGNDCFTCRGDVWIWPQPKRRTTKPFV